MVLVQKISLHLGSDLGAMICGRIYPLLKTDVVHVVQRASVFITGQYKGNRETHPNISV
jgi:hypothetical protein